MSKTIKWLALIILLVGVIMAAVFALSQDARQNAQIMALDKIGDIAVKRMAENPDAKGSVAAEFINIPIEARELSLGIWQATGVGNAHLITTSEGNVLFDTGLATQVPKQIKVLEKAAPQAPLTHIIVSHSHADHSGGVKFWKKRDTEIIAHKEFLEEQRYLTELQSYFWHRNRTLFPFMPEKPPTLGLIAYGGVEPTIEVRNGEAHKFSQGGIDFEVHALPGAEGADNVVLWLPQKKILFSGDFFGPLYPQFPNIFTMRGEKIRKPMEYINSLNKIIELNPDMIVPSHKDPIMDKAVITSGLVKMRDATQYVHDAVIDGMNAGKTVEQLMQDIELPPGLDLTQEHGKVSWAIKSIWEYYATWFHFDKTTKLYPVKQNSIHADIVELTSPEALVEKAKSYIAEDKPLEALHLLDILEGAKVNNPAAINARIAALNILKDRAENGDKNSYEIYWLNYRIRESQSRLDAQ